MGLSSGHPDRHLIVGGTDMNVRPYAPRDETTVVEIWQACDLLTNPLNDPVRDIAFCRDSGHGDVLILEQDEDVVGAAMVGHDGHRGWIYYVGVDPTKQQAGMGRTLMAAAEAWLGERGVPKVELLVREINTRVIGFYQRCGYQIEDRALLSKRLDGIAVAAGGQMSDDNVVISYLAMDHEPVPVRIEPKTKHLNLIKSGADVGFYRYLYDAVGRPWYWTDRKKLSDDELAAILGHDGVDVYVLYVDGAPAGYFELDARDMPTVDLAYFGILPAYIGLRLGPYLLSTAIQTAWQQKPQRLMVNTCTLDHPKALPMYQRFGFEIYDRIEVPSPWQRGDPILDDT
jgi:ribosomal protein S18 acetylase RimI-like enzyme